MSDRRLEGTLNGTTARDQPASELRRPGCPAAAAVGDRPALARAPSGPTPPQDVIRLRGSVQEEHTLARLGAERLWSLLHTEDYVERARRADRQPGGAAGQGRPEGHLPVRLAGGGRRQPGRRRPTRTRASTRPTRCPRWSAGSTTRCCAPTRSPGPSRRQRRRAALARADRRRRRGRLRRPAERLRADEVDDRGRRRRRALGGPARVREEVRPPRRQGAHPDRPAHQDAERRPAGRRRLRRAHRSSSPAPTRRPPRCITSDVDERDQPFVDRRADRRGLLPGPQRHRRRASPAAWPTRRTPTCSGWRPPRRTWTRRAEFAEAIHAALPGPDARLQLLAVVQLAGEPGRRDDREVPARAGRDGLQVPVHHPGRLPRAQPLDVRPGPRLRRARA